MRRSATRPFAICAWMIALLIGLAFVCLEYGLRQAIERSRLAETHSWLDLGLLLCTYLFVFCLKPIQTAIQRKLCLRATHR